MSTQYYRDKISRENKRERSEKAACTYIFVRVGVLVLRLVGHGHLAVGAVVLAVIVGGAVVCYNHQLLDVSLEAAEGRNRKL